jgi:hypothetical protein
MELEHAVADYYKACQAADYEFPSDIIDVIYDATEGAVKFGRNLMRHFKEKPYYVTLKYTDNSVETIYVDAKTRKGAIKKALNLQETSSPSITVLNVEKQ